MANEYFSKPADLAPYTRARAEDVNDRFSGVASGFDKLPEPHLTERGFREAVNVGDATTRTHAPSASQIIRGTLVSVTDTGVANAYIATLPIAPAALGTGMQVSFRAANTNTGASTLNVNGLGIKSIVRQTGNPLASGDIVAGQVVTVTYDGTRWVATSYLPGQAATIEAQVIAASDSAAAAAAARDAAQLARTGAETARTGAETAQTAAQTARTGAETARTGAETARDQAVTAETNAETARTGAETARTGAETAYTNTLAIYGSTLDVQAAVDTTNANVLLTNADAASTAADLVQTDTDTVATAADRVQTGLDRIQTGLDRAAAKVSADLAETAKDEAVAAWTAALAADQTLNSVIRINPQTLDTVAVIPSWYNAYSAGPLWVGDEAEVTVSDNATWNIL